MGAANRRDPRVACYARGRLTGPKGFINGVVRNVSMGGSFLATFESSDDVPLGQPMDIVIDIPGRRSINAVGEVCHVGRGRDGQGLGIRFWRMSGEDLTSLNAFFAHAF